MMPLVPGTTLLHLQQKQNRDEQLEQLASPTFASSKGLSLSLPISPCSRQEGQSFPASQVDRRAGAMRQLPPVLQRFSRPRGDTLHVMLLHMHNHHCPPSQMKKNYRGGLVPSTQTQKWLCLCSDAPRVLQIPPGKVHQSLPRWPQPVVLLQ